MNFFFKRTMALLFIIAFVLLSCTKGKINSSNSSGSQGSGDYQLPPPPPIPAVPPFECGNRPIINATLVPIGSLSSARVDMICAFAGNKILFVGGEHAGQNWWNEPVPVDIYDISNNTFITHYLVPDDPQFTYFREGAAIASIDNEILIAGGGDAMGDNVTSKVDIYDALTGTWSSAQLSAARQFLATATVGNKVLFAGGFGYPNGNNWGEFNTVDIYDNSSNTWSTATLSEARRNLTATAIGNKIYFAGGYIGTTPSNTIDIYDATKNSWSVSSLQQPRADMADIAVNDKIYWAGGSSGGTFTNNVETLNTSTGTSSFDCLLGRGNITAVKKDDNIVFFTGYIGPNDPHNGIDFEIYNTKTNIWSTGKLNQKVFWTAVISVNNAIYVAGGTDGSSYYNQVWKLEF